MVRNCQLFFFQDTFGKVERLCPNLQRCLIMVVGKFAFEGYSRARDLSLRSKSKNRVLC